MSAALAVLAILALLVVAVGAAIVALLRFAGCMGDAYAADAAPASLVRPLDCFTNPDLFAKPEDA